LWPNYYQYEMVLLLKLKHPFVYAFATPENTYQAAKLVDLKDLEDIL
jgi:hypothetical protein